MLAYKDYLEIVSEHYDLSDSNTLNKVILCTEAEKETVLLNLTNRLYNHISAKVDQIDFGTIPMSKGDITKIDNYENLVDCISTISSLIKEYNQSTEQIDVISTALDNIQTRTRVWEKGFGLHIELPMIIYNTMVLAIVSSVSVMITTCIEYVKDPEGTIKTAFDKAAYIKNKDHVLLTSLREFNFACTKGDIDKVIDQCIKTNVTRIKEAYEISEENHIPLEEISLNESTLFITAIGALTVLVNLKFVIRFIVYCLRNAVYYFMFMRQNVADYFTVQADYLQVNAENLQYREMDDAKREKVKDRQMKWVNRFRRWANFFMIKDKKAQNETKEQQKKDQKPKPHGEDDGGNEDNDDDGGIF